MNAVHNVIENRVYYLYQQHRRELRLSNRRSLLLNPEGFYLKLTDRRGSDRVFSDDIVIDEAGNLKVEAGIPTKQWDLPERDISVRLSLVRQYGSIPFRANRDGRSGTQNFASVGTLREAWQQTDKAYTGITYYGNESDIGTPGGSLRESIACAVIQFPSTADSNRCGYHQLGRPNRS